MNEINIAKKRLTVLILSSALIPLLESSTVSAGRHIDAELSVEVKSKTVYYCTGPNAKKYHSSSHCRGLRKCSCKIVKCSKSEALKKGFRPCKICY